MILFIILAALLIYLFLFIYPRIKSPNLGSLVLVNGGVKCGKTTLSIYLATHHYKNALLRWKIKAFFAKMLKKSPPEKPLLFSNIPLDVKYPVYLLTAEHIKRKVRFPYKSIIYIDEASLVADKSLYKDVVAEKTVSYFCKLIAHETRGGMCILDTQSIGDLSVAVRRNIASYLYIHDLIKWIPFILIGRVREERYSEDNTSIHNNYNDDVDDSMKFVIMPKKVWKYFDCYCYSKLTDSLNVSTIEQCIIDDDLRTDFIIDLNKAVPNEKV